MGANTSTEPNTYQRASNRTSKYIEIESVSKPSAQKPYSKKSLPKVSLNKLKYNFVFDRFSN